MTDIATRIREALKDPENGPYPMQRDAALYAVLDYLDAMPRRARSPIIFRQSVRNRIADALGLSTVESEATEWRPVRGFEDAYEVSDTGQVRRSGRGQGATVGRVLRPCGGMRSGFWVGLPRGPEPPRKALIHRLVAEAFLPPPGPGQDQVNHIDGDRANNSASNLEWATQSENIRHAYSTGLMKPRTGARPGRSKLTWREVGAIKASNESAKVLAARYDVTPHYIYRIRSGERWGWLIANGPAGSQPQADAAGDPYFDLDAEVRAERTADAASYHQENQ